MLDSPRSFILIIASVVVAITLVVFGTKAFKSEQEKSTDLNPVINTEEASQNKTTSTTPTPSKTTTAPKGATTNTVTPKVNANYTVNYYSSGFSPSNLTVKAGQSVRFVNQAGASMYVMAAPSGGGFSEFDQGKSVGRGGYYDFTFNRKGTFVYFNNNRKTDTAVITVE